MQIVAHTMEYHGGKIYSELSISNYSTDDYAEYKCIYEECYFCGLTVRSSRNLPFL